MARTRNFQVVEVPLPLALARKSTQQETKYWTMPGFGIDLREGESGTQRQGGIHNKQKSPGLKGTWLQAKGVKEGSTPSQETVAYSCTRRGV